MSDYQMNSSSRNLGETLFTVELGVLVPYPEEGKDAKDQRRPSALQRTQMLLHLKAQCDAYILSLICTYYTLINYSIYPTA